MNCNVIITDISKENLLKTKEKLINYYPNKTQKIIDFEMDVTNILSIKEILKRLNERSLIIDILINNAAIDHKVINQKNNINSNTFEDFELDKWNKEIEVGHRGISML